MLGTAKLTAIGLLLATAGYFLYNAGQDNRDNYWLNLNKALVEHTARLQETKDQQEILLSQERQKKQEIEIRTVTKVKREIIKLPPRDCGFTPDEQRLLVDTYCANFPSHPSCLPDPLPIPTRTSGSGG